MVAVLRYIPQLFFMQPFNITDIHCFVILLLLFCYVIIGPPNPDNLPEDGKLKSEVMIKDNRRYYLDLKENQRGRFLRVRHNTKSHRSHFMAVFSFALSNCLMGGCNSSILPVSSGPPPSPAPVKTTVESFKRHPHMNMGKCRKRQSAWIVASAFKSTVVLFYAFFLWLAFF